MRANVMTARILAAALTVTPVAAFLGFPPFRQPAPGTTKPPQETVSFLDNGQGVSPRPTPAPSRPQYGQFDLFKRLTGYTMGTDTCGFVATEWDDAFTCVRIGASCTNDGTFIGCCTNTGTDCFSTVKTACVDYTDSLSGACDNRSGSNTLCCAATTAQFCHSYTFTTTASPGRTLTLIDCDSTRGVGQLIDYPPSATKSTKTTSQSTTTSTSTSSTSSSSTTSSSSSTAALTTTITTTPTPTQSSEPSPSPTPVGAIVGGVVGGVAAIGLFVVAVLYLWRRSRDKDEAPAAPPTSQIPPSNPPLTHPSPSSPGQGPDSPFNPHYSYQSTPSTVFPSQTTSPQGLAYAVPDNRHPTSMYGSPPLQQAGWEGVAPAHTPAGQYPVTAFGEVNKAPSPAAVGAGYDYGVPQQQQQQQQPYQYPPQYGHQAPYTQTQGHH